MEPGSGRTVALTQTEVQSGTWKSTLTTITDVDSSTRTVGYNSLRQLTSDSWSPLFTSFTFSSSTGLLTGLTRGQNTTTMPYTIVSAAGNGLGSTVTLGAGLLSPPPAKVTDGNNHTTQYVLDLRGRLVQETDALSNNTYENKGDASIFLG